MKREFLYMVYSSLYMGPELRVWPLFILFKQKLHSVLQNWCIHKWKFKKLTRRKSVLTTLSTNKIDRGRTRSSGPHVKRRIYHVEKFSYHFLLIFLALSFFLLLLLPLSLLLLLLLFLLLLPPSLLFSASDGPTNIQSNSLKPELKSSYRGLKKLSCLFSFVAPIVNLALYIVCQKFSNFPSLPISKHFLKKGWNHNHTSIIFFENFRFCHFLLLIFIFYI